MQQTANFGLKKPEANEYYNVEDFNSNADIIDETMHALQEALKDAEAATPEDIGAAAKDHTQPASTITAGTFPETGVAAAAGTDYDTYRIRNVAILSATPSSMSNGDIALVYS